MPSLTTPGLKLAAFDMTVSLDETMYLLTGYGAVDCEARLKASLLKHVLAKLQRILACIPQTIFFFLQNLVRFLSIFCQFIDQFAVSEFGGFLPLSETMQNLAIIYGAVIDDVLSKVRSDFVQKGNE